jgi:hypothetical protein
MARLWVSDRVSLLNADPPAEAKGKGSIHVNKRGFLKLRGSCQKL